jgi:beta-fructofuranosidase
MDIAIARAVSYVDAFAPRCAADRQRPRCHMQPPARWMNDPNGTIHHRGWYHVFYQLNPFGDTWGFMHWGHARSRDLVSWENLPIALAPDVLSGEEHCYSGCIALDHDGTPRLIYTSVPFNADRADSRPFDQRGATPADDDLITWTRDPAPLIGPLTDRAARDPFVFRWRGQTFAVVGDGRRVALFTAPAGDLGKLQESGTLWQAQPGEMDFAECPNVVVLPDDRLVLLLSPYRAVEWRLGTFDGKNLSVQSQGIFDLHDTFYATNTLEDDAGRTVILGWIRGFPAGRGWSGCLAYPRLIDVDGDTLRQRVHPAIEQLCTPATTWNGAPTTIGDACRLRGHLRPGATLAINGHDLAWDGKNLTVDGTTWPLSGVDDIDIDIDIWLDRSVIEILAEKGRTVISRVRVLDTADGMLRGSGADLTISALNAPA